MYLLDQTALGIYPAKSTATSLYGIFHLYFGMALASDGQNSWPPQHVLDMIIDSQFGKPIRLHPKIHLSAISDDGLIKINSSMPGHRFDRSTWLDPNFGCNVVRHETRLAH